MAKAHTDLEQSKKLAEILPHESSDMFFGRQKWNSKEEAKNAAKWYIEKYY